MKILLASDHYPPFIGGAHRQIALLARELSARGHELSVVTIEQPSMPRHERQDDVDVHRLRQIRSFVRWPWGERQNHHPPFADPLAAWGIRRIVREFDPDVVHAYGWISFSCALALARVDIPMTVSARDYAYSCPTRTMVHDSRPCTGPALAKCVGCAARHYGPVKGVVAAGGVHASRNRLRRQVRGVHSISSYVQGITRRDFLRSEHPATENGVAEAIIPSFREDTEEPGEPISSYLEQLPDEPFILFVGALRRVKGIAELLAAYESLSNAPPLVLLGTVERDTPAKLPEGVRIVRDFPHSAVLAAMDRGLFAVFPSLWPEPFGSVVHEAMSRGLAVIGTRPGGHEEMIVDGETGRLVPRGDIGALVEAMRELLEDTATRERFGRAGRLRSRLFTAGEAIPQFESHYREVLGTLPPSDVATPTGDGNTRDLE